MARTAEELYREALSLSKAERERLALLLSSTRPSGFASAEVEQAWLNEIRRREQLDAEGKMEWFSAQDVLGELQKKYAE